MRPSRTEKHGNLQSEIVIIGGGGAGLAAAVAAAEKGASVMVLEKRAVPGGNSAFALGLFADGTYGDGWNGVAGTVKGLFYGDPSQLLAEGIGVLTNFVYVGLISLVIFKLIDLVVGNRVDKEAEMEGLDVPEMGVTGYSGVQLDKASETPRSR